MQIVPLPREHAAARLVEAVLDTCQSEHTRRAYKRALDDFLAWHDAAGRGALDKATVQRYVASLRDSGMGASSINQRLAAIRKLVREAADYGVLASDVAGAILRAKGAKQQGKRLGNWLSIEQATQLLSTPDTSQVKGIRDRAILAVLIGCGLRRHEAAALTWSNVQKRGGRAAIVDLRGKGNKLRSIPMPSWAATALEAWRVEVQRSEVTSNKQQVTSNKLVFLAVDRYGHIAQSGVTAQTIRNVVKEHATAAGLNIAPHDLRRTYAKLAHEGGADLKQIQLSLGHASVQTTEIYLGTAQDFQDAPADRLGIVL